MILCITLLISVSRSYKQFNFGFIGYRVLGVVSSTYQLDHRSLDRLFVCLMRILIIRFVAVPVHQLHPLRPSGLAVDGLALHSVAFQMAFHIHVLSKGQNTTLRNRLLDGNPNAVAFQGSDREGELEVKDFTKDVGEGLY
jgi:hypothetical protein